MTEVVDTETELKIAYLKAVNFEEEYQEIIDTYTQDCKDIDELIKNLTEEEEMYRSQVIKGKEDLEALLSMMETGGARESAKDAYWNATKEAYTDEEIKTLVEINNKLKAIDVPAKSAKVMQTMEQFYEGCAEAALGVQAN